ncbi:MAG: DNA recombination protein RmuC [Gemmatimonadaceae bacterium]|nr:DNA recombination protein RmuC [Gemmatimonadaceae bacterium]
MNVSFAFAAGVAFGLLGFWLVSRLKDRDTKALALELVRQADVAKTQEVDLLTSRMQESVKVLTSELITGGVQQLNDAARASLSRYTSDNQGALESKKELIDQSLESMNAKLEKVSVLVGELERDRERKFGELSKHLVDASSETTKLRDAADQLRGILSNPTARGQWGERLAEDVLRVAGLVEGINYAKQLPMSSGCRPDFTFMLPNGLILNMDVKFPLDNYLRSFECASESERKACTDQFKRDVQKTIKQVHERGYIDTAEKTVDYAILFVPNERVLSFLNECDATAIDGALRNKVVICSPFTLYAVLVVIRQAVDNFRFAQTTSEMLELHGVFNKEWAKFKGSFEAIKESIDGLQEAFETLATTRRRKLDGVLDRIDALRGPDAASSASLPTIGEEVPIS